MVRVDAVLVAIGRIGNAAILLLTLWAMTHFLDPNSYGFIAIFSAFQAFAGLVLINPFGQYINRYTIDWYESGTLMSRLALFQKYWIIAGSVTGSLCGGWLVLRYSQYDFFEVISIGGILAGTIYSSTSHGTRVAVLNMLGSRRECVFWQFSAAAASLVFSASMCFIWPSVYTWLAGSLLGMALCNWGAGHSLRNVQKNAWQMVRNDAAGGVPKREFWHFIIPLGITTSLMWLEGNSYRLILNNEWSLEQLGLFVMALSIPAQMTGILESIVIQFIYPHFFRAVMTNKSPEQRIRATNCMLDILLPLYLIWMAFLVLAAPHVLRIITDSRYHAAVQWVWVGVGAEFARLVGNVWQLVAQAEKDFAPAIGPYFVGTVGVLVGSLLTVWLELEVGDFCMLLLLALYIKAGLIVYVMTIRLPVRISLRRSATACFGFVGALSLVPFCSEALTVWSAIAYIGGLFVAMLFCAALHLKTSPDVTFILSHSLRDE